MEDIIVVGAGPAGSRIAQRLSHLGYRVTVVEERRRLDGDVCCTGIVSQECLGAYAFDQLVLREVSSARLISPSGECLALSRGTPVAAVVDRARLDLSLAEKAEASGAYYLFGAKVTDIQTSPGAVAVRIDGKGPAATLRAEVAVIASGFGSSLPRRLGLGEIRPFVLGAQAEVDTRGVDGVEIGVDQNLAPGGFTWLVPTTDGRGLAGLLTWNQADFYLKSLLGHLSAQGKIKGVNGEPGYRLAPLRPLPQTYADRILVVGAAAGQVKPTTGGGIYYGLLCADMAAEAVHQAFRAGDFSAGGLYVYEKRWKARFNRELTINYWLRALFTRLTNEHLDCLFRLANRKGVPQTVANARDFSFDWHSRLLLQLARGLMPFSQA